MKMFEKKWVLVISLLAMVLWVIIPVNAYLPYTAGAAGCDSHGVSCIPAAATENVSVGDTVQFWTWSAQWPNEYLTCNNSVRDGTTKIQNVCDNAIVGSDQGFDYWSHTCIVPASCNPGDKLETMWDYLNWDNEVAMKWNIIEPNPPVAAFSCTPLLAGVDSSIVCTDASSNAGTYYWIIDDETRDIHPLQTSTSHDYTWYTHYPGLYSVSLRVTNGAGTDWENKTNYVNITSSPIPTPTPTPGPTPIPGDVRSYFITIDASTQATIYDTNILLYDTYRGTWTNWTNDADGMGYIDTLPYTPINAYATYTKFSNTYIDAQLLGVSAGNSGLDWRISMYPYQGAPVGYTTLYVTTVAAQGGTIANTQVTAIWNSIQHVMSSGSYGTAIFTVPNNTQVSLTARHQGYLDGTKVINVGAGSTYSTTIYLNDIAYTQTPTTTHTTGPGGTVPTTIGPYGTPGPSGTYASGYTNNQGQKMLDFLATNGMGLVELCFMVTILALLGVKLGK